MTLSPAEQISNRHLKPEDQSELFGENMLPEVIFSRQPAMPQHPYSLTPVFVSHALPAVPIEGDGRAVANLTLPQSNMVPVSVPLRQAVVYPGYSSCATVYSTATRGSYSTLNRRHSGGSGDIPAAESPADDGSHDDSTNGGKVVQEVCRYFMRTGTCGYGDKCRYHHPQSAHRPKLNSMGYPQREAEHACPFYLKNGWCGFGATCKFNHPELPPLNVPTAAALMPQVLTHVPYSTIPPPPYANPGGAYSAVAPAPATPIMHWQMAPAGVPVNMSPPPQSGLYHQPYVSLPAVPAVPAWPMSKEQPSMTLGSHSAPFVSQRVYPKSGDSHQEAVPRHMSPKSEDSAFSVVGRDVSLPMHHPSIGVETKHVLMPMPAIEDASRVSVTTA